jgi:hypothetical protein
MDKIRNEHIVTCISVTVDGFGLVIGFIGLLQNVTTSNYSAIVNSHTQQFTTARTKSSQSALSSLVFW